MTNYASATVLCFVRQRPFVADYGHVMFARIRDMRVAIVCALFAPMAALIAGLAQGRIVSISRGSPPPKKR